MNMSFMTGQICICDLSKTTLGGDVLICPVLILDVKRVKGTMIIKMARIGRGRPANGRSIMVGKEEGLRCRSYAYIDESFYSENGKGIIKIVGYIKNEDLYERMKNMSPQSPPLRYGLLLCLCPDCLNYFMSNKDYIISRSREKTNKDICEFCRNKMGYDYWLHRKRKKNTDGIQRFFVDKEKRILKYKYDNSI